MAFVRTYIRSFQKLILANNLIVVGYKVTRSIINFYLKNLSHSKQETQKVVCSQDIFKRNLNQKQKTSKQPVEHSSLNVIQ